jgi:hypothetical protein
MITESNIGAAAGTCCTSNARIGGMRLDGDYEATALRTGNDAPPIKFDYWFQCLHCSRIFGGYVVCGREDWPPLGEYVDLSSGVPQSKLASTFESLRL